MRVAINNTIDKSIACVVALFETTIPYYLTILILIFIAPKNKKGIFVMK